MRREVEDTLAQQFKPEFLNRVDDIVIFRRLTKDEIKQIVDLQVAQLVKRVKERGIDVELNDDARNLIVNLGFDPTFGARPLKRVIQKQLVDRLALAILEGKFQDGDAVRVEAKDGKLEFEKAKAKAKAAVAQ